MVKLIWSRQAGSDLEGVCEYIRRDSEKYARLVARSIFTIIEKLPSNPHLGAVVPEYGRDDLRERLFQNYRIICRVKSNAIQVVTIVHGARRLSLSKSDVEGD